VIIVRSKKSYHDLRVEMGSNTTNSVSGSSEGARSAKSARKEARDARKIISLYTYDHDDVIRKNGIEEERRNRRNRTSYECVVREIFSEAV